MTEIVHCSECRFWQGKSANPEISNQGYCHLNPPTRQPKEFNYHWPSIKTTDWCGKGERKE